MLKNGNLSKKENEMLLGISMQYSVCMKERRSFEVMNSDQEDFIEVSVYGLQKMLEEAYRAGIKEGAK